MNSLSVGQVVFSKCGRDKGKVMVVVDLASEPRNDVPLYVYLVDGVLRTLDRPKKKKVKHVQPTGYTVDLVVPDGRALQDADIRKQLKRLCNGTKP